MQCSSVLEYRMRNAEFGINGGEAMLRILILLFTFYILILNLAFSILNLAFSAHRAPLKSVNCILNKRKLLASVYFLLFTTMPRLLASLTSSVRVLKPVFSIRC